MPGKITLEKRLSWPELKMLLDSSETLLEDLRDIYARLPETRCLRQGFCCSLLPEMSFAEALSAFHSLMVLKPNRRQGIFTRLVGSFFSNAFEVAPCPFLEENHCLIYPERFFGCRAYGLWSPGHYEKRAALNRQSKQVLLENWRRLDVNLPTAVVEFYQPYCLQVKPGTENGGIEDETLEQLGGAVDRLSEQLGDWNLLFVQSYFSDIRFLAASLIFGPVQATRLKFTLVRDFLTTGNRSPLNRLLETLPSLEDLS